MIFLINILFIINKKKGVNSSKKGIEKKDENRQEIQGIYIEDLNKEEIQVKHIII